MLLPTAAEPLPAQSELARPLALGPIWGNSTTALVSLRVSLNYTLSLCEEGWQKVLGSNLNSGGYWLSDLEYHFSSPRPKLLALRMRIYLCYGVV